VVTRYLKFAELDEKGFDKELKLVVTVGHKSLSLLFSHNTALKNVRVLKVWEKQNENLLRISRNLNEVQHPINVMKVAI
jgi:RNase P/RNase MRP subunit POP5